MKHTKRWVSLLLAVMMTVAAPLSAFAAWEDGFVIPGQNSGSNSYGKDRIAMTFHIPKPPSGSVRLLMYA